MDLQKLNNWLALAANIGVLVGIVLLALEIRQNTTVIESSTYQDRTQDLREALTMVTESEHLSTGLAKLGWFQNKCQIDSTVIENLEAHEYVAIQAYLRASWFRFENLYYQYTTGTMDRRSFENGTLNAIANYLPWWELFQVPQARSGKNILDEFDFDSQNMECLL